jgi:hypothetical protein
VLAALRECAESLKHPPSMPEYMQWVRHPEVAARPGRRPRSYHPFQRLGGWRHGLIKAGVIAEDDVRHGVDGRPLPRRYAYSTPEVTEAVRSVADRLGRSPRPGEYSRERERIWEETKAKGDMHLLPTTDVVRRCFGSWNAALSAAGLETVDHPVPPFTGRKRPAYSPEEKIQSVQRAWRDVGEPFTARAYVEWRRSQVERGLEIPSLAVLTKTFGNWGAACRAALPAQNAKAWRRRIHELAKLTRRLLRYRQCSPRLPAGLIEELGRALHARVNQPRSAATRRIEKLGFLARLRRRAVGSPRRRLRMRFRRVTATPASFRSRSASSFAVRPVAVMLGKA